MEETSSSVQSDTPLIESEGGSPVAKVVHLVFSNAAPGKGAEYREWYLETHIPELMHLAPFQAAQFFEVVGEEDGGAPSQWRFLTVLEVDDAPSERQALAEATDNPPVPHPPGPLGFLEPARSLMTDGRQHFYFRALSERFEPTIPEGDRHVSGEIDVTPRSLPR